jgi:hypothetical protein
VALVIEELGAAMGRSLNQNVLPIYGPTTFREIPFFLKPVGYFLPFPRSSWDLKNRNNCIFYPVSTVSVLV